MIHGRQEVGFTNTKAAIEVKTWRSRLGFPAEELLGTTSDEV